MSDLLILKCLCWYRWHKKN